MAIQTQAQLLARVSISPYNMGPQGIGPVEHALLTDIIDTMFTGGFDPKQSVRAVCVEALPAYTRVAAVITADANGALPDIDGVTLVVGNRVLLPGDIAASGDDSGIYVVTSLGAAGAKFVLTRAADYTTDATVAGSFFPVEEGTVWADRMLMCTNDAGSDIVGTDTLLFGPFVIETVSSLMPPAVGCAVAALPAYTIVGGVMTEDAAAAGFPTIDGTVTPVAGDIFIHTSGAAPADNGWWQLVDAGGVADVFVAVRPPCFPVGQAIGGQFGRVLGGTQWGQKTVTLSEITGVVQTDAVTIVEAHGALSDGRVLDHDSDDIEDMSVVGAADLTTLLDDLISAAYAQDARSTVELATELVTSDGAVKTIAVYDIDWTAAAQACAAGLWDAIAAGNDVVICGAGLWAGGSYQLDGTDAVVITADGLSLHVALVLCRCTSGLVLTAVFGDEAAFGTALEPDATEIAAALDAALALTPAGPLVGLDTRSMVVWGRILVDRVAVNIINYTHTAPSTDSALMTERKNGQLGSLA